MDMNTIDFFSLITYDLQGQTLSVIKILVNCHKNIWIEARMIPNMHVCSHKNTSYFGGQPKSSLLNIKCQNPNEQNDMKLSKKNVITSRINLFFSYTLLAQLMHQHCCVQSRLLFTLPLIQSLNMNVDYSLTDILAGQFIRPIMAFSLLWDI